jgi:amino acid adenylation domain-containing protein/non-ribosomal peptide synthase protein (TIGR01720 family)
MQQGMLFHSLEDAGEAVYFEQACYTYRKHLDAAVCRQSWEYLVSRHAILRTAFEWRHKGEPVQVVHRQVRLPWREEDWRGMSPSRQQQRLAALLEEDRATPFNLRQPPLMRITVVRLEDALWKLVWSFHHLLLDALSSQLLRNELNSAYDTFLGGRSPVAPTAVPYRAYIEWLSRQDAASAERFWRDMLGDFTRPTGISALRRSLAHGAQTAQHSAAASLSTEETQAVKQCGRHLHVTVNALIQAAWALLLARYSGEDDVVFGMTVEGRPVDLARSREMVGLFINTVPVRVRVPRHARIPEWLNDLQLLQAEARQFEYSPLSRIQQWSGAPPGTRLFETILSVQSAPETIAAARSDSDTEAVEFYEKTNYPIAATAAFDPNLALQIRCADARIPAAATDRLAEQWKALLLSLVSDQERTLGELSPLSLADHRLLVFGWNATDTPHPARCSVQAAFEDQAERTPDGVAIVDGAEHITYSQLNRRANQLARYLRSRGVRVEDRVAVCAPRSWHTIAGWLAAIKAGAAYVPLDANHPAARLKRIVEAVKARVLLGGGDVPDMFADAPGLAVVRMDSPERVETIYETTDLAVPVCDSNLAYIIYTSGSSGEPKGVMARHGGLLNLAWWHRDGYRLECHTRSTHLASAGFDAAAWEVWPYLLTGGTVLLVDDATQRDPARLAEFFERNEIEVSFVPTPIAELLIATVWPLARSLRHLLTGGDRLHGGAPGERRFVENHYGPTEATVVTTAGRVGVCDSGRNPSIGKPIANTRVYVLDDAMQPAPIGVPGELYIGGDGICRGYWGQPGLTAERFVPEPLSGRPGERLYRTGDRVCWREDGVLEFLGRIDAQVKIRGCRLETGEVEAALAALPGARQAAVTMQECAGESRLVGYVAGGAELNSERLREALSRTLPDFMLPHRIMILPALPLSLHGKVDRAALPVPEWGVGSEERVMPRTEAERVLAGIWSAVLGLPEIGVEDNFFELGGDSILSIQVAARAVEAGLRLTPRQVFQHPTVAGLAQVAEPGSRAAAASEAAGPSGGLSRLHPIQQWFFEQQLAEPHWWNQSLWMELHEVVDGAAMARAWAAVVEHHEALRMRFVETAEGWRQYSSREERAVLSEVDLTGLSGEAQGHWLERTAGQIQSSLDLSAGPVARACLARLGEGGRDRLLLVAHHLVVDIVSWTIVSEDLQQAYEQILRGEEVRLAGVTASYRSWCERLAEYGQSGAMEGEAEHWEEALRGRCGSVVVEHEEGENREGQAEEHSVQLSAGETEAVVQGAGRAYQMQPGEVLLAALGRAVGEWSGAEAVVLEVEGHGREEVWSEVDLTRTVGWFTALYPMRVASGGPLGKALKQVKEQVRQTPLGGLGYGVLRYAGSAEVQERMKRLPRGAISVNYVGRRRTSGGGKARQAVDRAAAEHSPRAERRHEIDITAGIADECLWIHFAYGRERYEGATMERLGAAVKRQLAAIAGHCQGEGGYTPSDFPMAGLEQAGLDRLMGEIAQRRGGQRAEIEDIYRLSPMQQGMLFHSVLDAGSGVYFVQNSSRLRIVDVGAFRGAWERLVGRHGVLRTGFEWEQDEPLQVVYRGSELPWVEEDWSGLSGQEQGRKLQEALEQDRARGFELSCAPLMRVRAIRLEKEWWQVIWSYHHLLLDGWSTARLLEELTQIYDGLRTGAAVELAPVRPYADYIRWLSGCDMAAAETFWRERLRGFTSPARLPFVLPDAGEGSPADYVGDEERLPAEVVSALDAMSAQCGLTLNTLVQGAWALVLARCADVPDVVFGSTVAGRPVDLPDSGKIMGLFIDTLPVRASVAPHVPVLEWLRDLQAAQAEARQYEYASLPDIARWSEVPRGQALFDTIVVVDNYRTGNQGGGDNTATVVEGFEKSNYALTLTVTRLGPEIRLLLEYDRRCCLPQNARTILHALNRLLTAIPGRQTERVEQLLNLLPACERAASAV